jgi:hypothetical protein
MRANRTYGSEGGEGHNPSRPLSFISLEFELDAVARGGGMLIWERGSEDDCRLHRVAQPLNVEA